MSREIEIPVNTTVTVSIDEIPTSELIDVLMDRGHSVDDGAIESAKTDVLIKELQDRSDWRYEDVPIFDLIEALHHWGCPDDLIEKLKAWAETPIANEEKLEKWKALVG